jgi:hypothetical protein
VTGLAGPRRRRRRPARRDPFADLGLDAAAGLTDDEIRAAWRRIAAASHPDRTDGGDPARYAAAAAAYTDLRTSYGRGEALAARRERAAGAPGRISALRRVLTRLPGRVSRGRPVRLTLRCTAALAVGWLALAAGAMNGSGPALAVGAVTWLILTAPRDLAP